MATRPGDVKVGTFLNVSELGSAFLISIVSPKNAWSEPEFVEFTRSGSKSFETLLALDNLYASLRTDGIFLANDYYSLKLFDGSLEILQDADGNKYIRVWNPATKMPCELTIRNQNAPSIVVYRLQELLIAMELDDRLCPLGY